MTQKQLNKILKSYGVKLVRVGYQYRGKKMIQPSGIYEHKHPLIKDDIQPPIFRIDNIGTMSKQV